MSKGPYKTGPVPQWLIEQQAQDMHKYNQNYMQPHLQKSTPDIYIIGNRYDGNTGVMIK